MHISDSSEGTFPLEREILWIEDSYFSQKQQFELQNTLIIDLLITTTYNFHFTRHSIIDWSHANYLWITVMFLSIVWTLILMAPIHFTASEYYSLCNSVCWIKIKCVGQKWKFVPLNVLNQAVKPTPAQAPVSSLLCERWEHIVAWSSPLHRWGWADCHAD